MLNVTVLVFHVSILYVVLLYVCSLMYVFLMYGISYFIRKITHLFFFSTEKTDDNGLLSGFDNDVLVLAVSKVWHSWLGEMNRTQGSQNCTKIASLGILKLEQQNLKEPSDIFTRQPRTLQTLHTIFSLAALPPYHHTQFMVNTHRMEG